MRESAITRTTAETDIRLQLNLDGTGANKIQTGSGFMNHMLTLFSVHSSFDLALICKGDTDVDFHHSAEDIGIALGKAFYDAVGDKKGIFRYGDIILPMDEALILCAADISGRGHLSFDAEMPAEKVGEFDTELVKEFFLAFVREAKITLHIKKIDGENTHHIIEGIFKAFARVLSRAASIDEKKIGVIPSSKGVL